MNEGSFCSTTSLTCVIACLVDRSPSNSFEVISHCSFNLHFSKASEVDHLFIHLLTIYMSSCEKFYFLIGFFVVILYEFFIYFDINLLSELLFANTFSYLFF